MGHAVDLVEVDKVPRSFAIGRHQVTIAQYRAFLEDTGWRAPRSWPSRSSDSDHRMPVSWVNHFDANAYCYWLSVQIGQVFALPSTTMLRAAARSSESMVLLEKESRTVAESIPYRPQGMQMFMVDQAVKDVQKRATSRYPWGESPDPRRCNCKEFRPHRPGPTPIDHFGEMGRSACGVEDLSGNLWEMSSTVKTPEARVVEVDGNFYDPGAPYPEFLHFQGTWETTLASVIGSGEKSRFAWEFQFDLFGGSYGTSAAECRTDAPTAWTSAANLGPYAGFRIATYSGRRHSVRAEN